jgi:Meiotically up-regulated gene 113
LPGFVYIIQASSGHVKIGKANNVQSRLSALRTASPFPLILINSIPCEDPSSIEKTLHRLFSDKRVNGEWFMLHIKDIEYLIGLNEESIPFPDPEDAEAEEIYVADSNEYWIDSITPLWGEL